MSGFCVCVCVCDTVLFLCAMCWSHGSFGVMKIEWKRSMYCKCLVKCSMLSSFTVMVKGTLGVCTYVLFFLSPLDSETSWRGWFGFIRNKSNLSFLFIYTFFRLISFMLYIFINADCISFVLWEFLREHVVVFFSAHRTRGSGACVHSSTGEAERDWVDSLKR